MTWMNHRALEFAASGYWKSRRRKQLNLWDEQIESATEINVFCCLYSDDNVCYHDVGLMSCCVVVGSWESHVSVGNRLRNLYMLLLHRGQWRITCYNIVIVWFSCDFTVKYCERSCVALADLEMYRIVIFSIRPNTNIWQIRILNCYCYCSIYYAFYNYQVTNDSSVFGFGWSLCTFTSYIYLLTNVVRWC